MSHMETTQTNAKIHLTLLLQDNKPYYMFTVKSINGNEVRQLNGFDIEKTLADIGVQLTGIFATNKGASSKYTADGFVADWAK